MMKQAATLLPLLATLTGCLHFSVNPERHYDLSIDPSFSDEQSNAIIAAATEWEVKSGNFITFDGAAPASGNETITFVTAKEQPIDADAYGCTWNEGVPSEISMRTSLPIPLFQQTATHELGHSLGLAHSTSGNIMCFSDGCASKHVTCGDLKELCNTWGCDASTMPGCMEK